MFQMLHKLNLLFHQIIFWLYSDNERSWTIGGCLGAGFSTAVLHINYLYWIKVVVSALVGGTVNILVKKLIDYIGKRMGKEGHPNE